MKNFIKKMYLIQWFMKCQRNNRKVNNMNKEVLLMILVKNIITLVCFTILAIQFEHWWIVFFSAFFLTTTGGEQNK